MIVALLPGATRAEVCDKERPAWDGLPESGIGEAIALFSAAPSLILLLATALVIRFRSSWGALAVAVLWAFLVSLLAFKGPGDIAMQAIAEGCIGSPTLFIATVTAISVAMILYTAPRSGRSD